MTKSWFVYLGGKEADVADIKNYSKVSIKPNCLCGPQLCAIYALGDEKHPISPLSKNLLIYIEDALKTQQLQPEKPYSAKKFVYLR